MLNVRPQIVEAVIERALGVLDRQDAAVDLDRAVVGNRVDADAPRDRADAERRMAAEWVRSESRHHLAGIGLQSTQHPRHVVKGVVALVRLRAVRRPALRDAPPAGRSLVSNDDVELRRLGDDRHIRRTIEQLRPASRRRDLRAAAAVGHAAGVSRRPMRGPSKAVLLVYRAGEDHGRPALRLFLGEPGHGRNHRGHASLDVARPAAIQPAVFDLARERVDGHAFDRHGVLVGFEHDDAAATLGGHIALDARDDVVPLRARPYAVQLANPGCETALRDAP